MLDAHGIAYRISTVPGLDVKQVNFTDPVGVGIELAFEEQGMRSSASTRLWVKVTPVPG